MTVNLRAISFNDKVPEHIIVIGLAGEPPAATDDVADFLFVVPYDLTLIGLQATIKTAPSANLTLQLRRSTNSGTSFSNAFGTVTVDSGDKVGSNSPSPLDVDAGDILNFSVTAGGGSGENLALFIRARRK